MAVESKILDHPACKDGDLAAAFKVTSEGFRGQLPCRRQPEREKERERNRDLCVEIDSPDVSRRVRVLLHPVRSRTFVYRSNPPLSTIPTFPGDLRDRILQLADTFNAARKTTRLAPLNA